MNRSSIRMDTSHTYPLLSGAKSKKRCQFSWTVEPRQTRREAPQDGDFAPNFLNSPDRSGQAWTLLDLDGNLATTTGSEPIAGSENCAVNEDVRFGAVLRGFPQSFVMLLLASIVPERGNAQHPIQTTTLWISLDSRQEEDRWIVRRYSPLTGPADLRNIISLHCKQGTGVPVLVVTIPKEAGPASFSRDDWATDIPVRILTDHAGFTMLAEYIKGELFFDRTTETRERFDAVLATHKLGLEFGRKRDRLQFVFGQNVDNFWRDISNWEPIRRMGPMSYFSTAEALSRCLRIVQRM